MEEVESAEEDEEAVNGFLRDLACVTSDSLP
jgi:hypothetical protein